MTSNESIDWPRYIEHLRTSSSLESLVEVLVSQMWRCVEQATASSPYADGVSQLRAVLHLKPGGVYRTIMAHPKGSGEMVSSATLWRCLEQCPRGAVAIDVLVGLMDLGLGSGGVERVDITEPGQWDAQSSSLQHFLALDTTHILLVPLWGSDEALVGMITFEVSCRAAIGADFVWASCARRLLDLAFVTCPYLLARPRVTTSTAPMTSHLLPVIGEQMRPIVEMLDIFSRSSEVLLISGPTGAGKSRIARWCHAQSKQSEHPFERLNLLTVPDDMQMAHLVGWRRGAFTGADKDVEGSLSRANGGTLFIDEVDKLSLPAQAGLLQVLDERTYRVLGASGKPSTCDVRFIFGTNVSLLDAVRRGDFREDLYYRINVLPVALPPLRDRRDEITSWACTLLSRCADRPEHTFDLDEEGAMLLTRYKWPGNLRQLDNVMRRALVLSQILEPTTNRISAEAIRRALHMEGGSSTKAGSPLERAATFVVDRAIETSHDGPIPFKLLDGFRGLVLDAAIYQLGSKDAAFHLFGLDNLVQHRNHHSTYRREEKKKDALMQRFELPQ